MFLFLLAAATGYLLVLSAGYLLGGLEVKRHHVESASFILSALIVSRLLPSRFSDSPRFEQSRRLTFSVVAVGVVLFWSVIAIGLLSDDFVLRRWAVAGRMTWPEGEFVRPIALVIWRLILTLGGSAGALHSLNLTLHLTNTWLVGRLAARLGLGNVGIAIVMSVFLLWPTQVEAVAWAAGVFDLLASTWILAAVLIFLREDPRPWGRQRPLLLLFSVLAFFTKENAIVLPVILIAFALMEHRPNVAARNRRLVSAVLIGCVAAIYIGWRFAHGSPVAPIASISRYIVKEHLVRTYATLILPFSGERVNNDPVVALMFAAVIVIAIVAVTARDQVGRPYHASLLAGALWCGLATLPTIGFLFVGPYLEGSRYFYLATFGWALILGAVTEELANRRGLRPAVIGTCVIVLAVAVLEQRARITDWRASATERDRILFEAARLAEEQRCGAVRAINLPARWRGAQLFNNGFNEALEGVRGGQAGDRGRCEWIWTGTAFTTK